MDSLRLCPSRSFFWMVGALVTAVGLSSAAYAGPVLVPDKNNPGYYKPFRCLSIDQNVGALPAQRGIRNNCGYNVEAYWRVAGSGGSQWTIKASDWYPLFNQEISGAVLGCLPNDHLNRSLSLCKDSSYKSKPEKTSEADQLAKELGVSIPTRPQTNDVKDLADQLGVSLNTGKEKPGRGDDLHRQMQQWEKQQAERAAQERESRIRQEQEALAAKERARQEASLRQMQMEQQSVANSTNSRADECSGFWGAVGCVAEGTGRTALQIDMQRKGYGAAIPTAYSTQSSMDSADCRHDQALINRVQSIMDSCNTNGYGICETARTRASCFGRAAAAAGSCESVANQARDMQRQYEAQAQSVCM